MKYDIDSLQFRTLHADEIELRVGTVSAKGATLLLYQDSRCAMNILDETVGRSNWQRDHKEVKGNMYCGIAIWDADKAQWVWKWDCGTESNTEKEKGEASDAMKRSAVNWGIARELYTSPLIFVNVDTQKKQTGRGYELVNQYVFSGARVTDIGYDDKRRISALTIVDKDGVVMYSFPRGKKASPKKSAPKKQEEPVTMNLGTLSPQDMITAEQAEGIKGLLEDLNIDTKVFLGYIAKQSNDSCDSVDGMTATQYDIAVDAINRKLQKLNEASKGE